MDSSPLARWHDIVASHDLAGLDDVLDDACVFYSPALNTPQAGRALTKSYLTAALHVLNTESFRYVGEWRSERGAVLEFTLVLDGMAIDGVDIIQWNDAGRIDSFKVMIRPFKALTTVMTFMAKQLETAAPLK